MANVGTTNTGAIDPLPEILAIAREHGLWVHADAAYGGFFRLAPGGAALLRGIEECDSITLDPHKGLFLPYGLGALLVRDGGALARAHRDTASYVQDVAEEGSLGFADLSPELSRDFRGLRLWLPLMLHGVAAFREQLAEKLSLARWAYRRARGRPPLRDARRAPALGRGLPPPGAGRTRPTASAPSCSAASTRAGASSSPAPGWTAATSSASAS